MAELDQRAALAKTFVADAGWSGAAQSVVAGDASNRRYDRLRRTDGSSVILMDAPADKGEDIRPFVHVAEFLTGAGFSAPKIIAQDSVHGFLLIEDLGDDLFARVLERDPALEMPLYEAATDVLVALCRVAPPQLAPYDAATMVPLAGLAYHWYLGAGKDAAATELQREFEEIFKPLLAPLDGQATVLIQRDYHAENLLWLPEREGAARVGLLDFQDAMLGHPAYDMVSFLQDARRDVPAAVETAMKARFCTAMDTDPAEFERAYALLGAQRNLRILGVFARLCIRDGKAHYVDLIPRVWDHLQSNLAHPALAPLKVHVDAHLPAPTPEFLARLKALCPKP
ncbi:MAG: aminoglycoside phosphotransferase family protein [Sulfitobacter sp.]